MGKGRKPKPLELRKLQGNPGKRKIPNVQKANPIAEDQPPPDWLDRRGKDFWRKIIRDNAPIKLITENDLNSLAAYCHAYSRYIEAERNAQPEVIEKTIKVRLKKGYKIITQLVKNPWVTVARNYFDMMDRLAARFGFSPVDRVKTGVAPKDDDEDEISRFLRRKNG